MPNLNQDFWDPELYARFEKERSAPFYDLMNMVQPEHFEKVLDLGCGTGEKTRILHEHFGSSETVGVDSSKAMLKKARSVTRDGVSFRIGGIEDFSGQQDYDLIFSNAALQWVDGHADLLPRFYSALKPGGQIAVQVPANYDYPTHVLAFELAYSEKYRDAFSDAQKMNWVEKPEHYSRLLHDCGFRDQKVRLQVYAHVLPSRDEVLEWVQGTLMHYFKERLEPARYDTFWQEYQQQLFAILPQEKPFFYPFKRILFWAHK